MPAKEGYSDTVLDYSKDVALNSVKKVSGQVHSDAFKKATFQLHSNNFGLKQLSNTVKTKVLQNKVILKFKKQFACVAMHFLVMSRVHVTSF